MIVAQLPYEPTDLKGNEWVRSDPGGGQKGPHPVGPGAGLW